MVMGVVVAGGGPTGEHFQRQDVQQPQSLQPGVVDHILGHAPREIEEGSERVRLNDYLAEE